jgi:hypothetical protein
MSSSSSRAEDQTTARVIPFPQTSVPQMLEPSIDWIELLRNSQSTAESLKSVIEAAVLNAYVRTQISAPAAAIDNPFDPVYISELQPDHITPADRSAMRRRDSIVDLSDSISFADGWDD